MNKNTKNILILGIILIVLVVMYMVTVATKPQAKQRKKISLPLIKGLDIANIGIASIGSDYELQKFNEVWVLNLNNEEADVTRYPVKQDEVQMFLDELLETKQGRLVSKTPKDLTNYNLNDESKPYLLALKSSDNTELFSLRVGAVSGANATNFAQINSDGPVYQIEGNIVSYLDNTYLDWADLRLYPSNISVDNVAKYEIKSYNVATQELSKNMILERNDTGWNVVGSGRQKADPVITEKYISDVFALEGTNLTSVELNENMKTNTITVSFKSGNDVQLHLYFFVDTYYAKTKGGKDDLTFILSTPVVKDRFIVDEAHFHAPPEEDKEENKEATESEDITTDGKDIPTITP